MSVLSDRTIRELCQYADMVRLPGRSKPLTIQPVSVDVHLDAVSSHHGVRITGETWSEVTPSAGAFLLGCTEEEFRMPDNVVGMVVGKSGIARAGMQVECAGLVDPGFEGQLTLELANLLPVTGLALRRGMAIAQVMFMWVDTPVEVTYGAEMLGSHYQSQRGPTPSHLL